MKAYTDLEQSKKLAEILPLESADMVWISIDNDESFDGNWEVLPKTSSLIAKDDNQVPCWSLAALLDILPKKYYPIKDHKTDLILGKPKGKWCALYWDATGMQDGEQTLGDNPVDACVGMILKLNELKVL